MVIAAARLGRLGQTRFGPSDIVQETLLVAHRARDTFRGETVEEMQGWLRAILRNVLSAILKRESAASRDVAREVAAVLGDLEWAGPDETPSKLVLQRERHEVLMEAVRRLPEEQRRVVVLRCEEELTFSEIGERLGKGDDAVRMQFHRAKEKLRDCLAEAGYS